MGRNIRGSSGAGIAPTVSIFPAGRASARPIRRTLIEADLVAPLPGDVQPYDVVVALDVIEHIDDDRAAVANLRRLTRPGGIAIVSVPALPELFTEFDQVQGHRRRYVPETLRQAFAGSGFTVEKILWWGGWLVPLLRWQRSRQQSRQRPRQDMTATEIYAEYVKLPPRMIAIALRAAFMIDHRLALRGLITRGTSLIAIARA
jgi:SAM-dependent methyltransferase